jgi:hypothetical protein
MTSARKKYSVCCIQIITYFVYLCYIHMSSIPKLPPRQLYTNFRYTVEIDGFDLFDNITSIDPLLKVTRMSDELTFTDITIMRLRKWTMVDDLGFQPLYKQCVINNVLPRVKINIYGLQIGHNKPNPQFLGKVVYNGCTLVEYSLVENHSEEIKPVTIGQHPEMIPSMFEKIVLRYLNNSEIIETFPTVSFAGVTSKCVCTATE